LIRQAETEYNEYANETEGGMSMVRKVAASKDSSTRAKDIARLKKIQENIWALVEEADEILRAYPEARGKSRGWAWRVFGCMAHPAKLDDFDLDVFSPRTTMGDTIKELEAESKA
jgi:hypothetical protein